MKKGVAHLRVSTPRQRRSGFGISAQRRIIRYFFKVNGILLVKEFVEYGSGRPRKRPEVQKTLDYCRKHNLTLYVANQSRLARNVGFICDLLDSKFDYINIEKPDADEFEKILQALMDWKAAEDISRNTKNSLISAAKKGVKFGGNSKKRRKTMQRKRKAFLKRMRPIIRRLWSQGVQTVRAITEKLIQKGIKNYRGIKSGWHISTVHQLLKELKY